MEARSRGRKALLLGAVLAAAWVIPVPAGADPVGGDWVADARASAVDVGMVTTGGFIVDRFDPSGALAVSHLETGPQVANSLASAPYPSEIGQQGPGLLYGVLQNTLPYNGIPVPALGAAPAWPWTIRSSANGSDPASASSGGETSPVWLKTESHDRRAAGRAVTGGSGPGSSALLRMSAESSADATRPATAAVKAVSTVENLVVGDALKIGSIRTELNIKQVSGARPEVTTRREVTGISVGGVAAEMGPDGFVLKDTKAPLPQPALDALKAAGIQVRVGEQHDSAGLIRTSGLVIRMPFDFSQMSGGQLPLSVPKTMVVEMAFGVATGGLTDLSAGPVSAPAGESSEETPAEFRPALRLIADTAPVGTGPQQNKEMGRLGWMAEITAIAVVLLLVIRRGRRVVGGA
jgi:hypothetical protein